MVYFLFPPTSRHKKAHHRARRSRDSLLHAYAYDVMDRPVDS